MSMVVCLQTHVAFGEGRAPEITVTKVNKIPRTSSETHLFVDYIALQPREPILLLYINKSHRWHSFPPTDQDELRYSGRSYRTPETTYQVRTYLTWPCFYCPLENISSLKKPQHISHV